ncbi:hypothetical protein BpHYR1_022512 [Brachionus plicatilis]|uniref:Uncharacterized protein n=1 Tax=Brachionus plicatilis TaxID=10195 RepID=A0A3M7R4G6_BRAPC|nr:hypothetical protein BpHYR1_022512 [Brachionus plicatilis]
MKWYILPGISLEYPSHSVKLLFCISGLCLAGGIGRTCKKKKLVSSLVPTTLFGSNVSLAQNISFHSDYLVVVFGLGIKTLIHTLSYEKYAIKNSFISTVVIAHLLYFKRKIKNKDLDSLNTIIKKFQVVITIVSL